MSASPDLGALAKAAKAGIPLRRQRWLLKCFCPGRGLSFNSASVGMPFCCGARQKLAYGSPANSVVSLESAQDNTP